MSKKFNFLSWVVILLYPFALVYGAIVWIRNRLYDAGFFSSAEFSIPVITVGNLSVGGTGKTPHVEYLIRLLQYRYQVSTMSRGYKRRTQGYLLADEKTNSLHIGDEPMQYHIKFPELAVSVSEDRMTGIPQLVSQRPDLDVVLLDDAFQHRSVKAGLNILITEYSRPYYSDFILPLGGLREGRGAAKRADIIVVSKCPVNLDAPAAGKMKEKIKPSSRQHVFFTSLQYGTPYDFFNGQPSVLKGRNALLVCGIARPEPLIEMLEGQCLAVHTLRYPDHHYFLQKDLGEIGETLKNWSVENKVIVTTEKDATRLHLYKDRLAEEGWMIIVLPVQVTFLLNGQQAFDALIESNISEGLEEYRGHEHLSEERH